MVVSKFGLAQSSAGSCVYFKHEIDEFTSVLIYVDDGLSTISTNSAAIKEIILQLGSQFQMRSMGVGRFIEVNI